MGTVFRRKLLSRELIKSIGVRRFSAKIIPRLDPEVEEKIKENTISPRRHPGVMNHKTVTLPESLLKAASKVISHKLEEPNIFKQIEALKNHLKSKKPPTTDQKLRSLAMTFEQELEAEDNITDISLLPEDERNRILQSRRDRLLQKLRKNVYHWEPVSYDENMAPVYLMARAAPDYASVLQVLREIKQRDTGFKPQTLLDFGSGVGSAVWAANETWQNIKEKFCVDVSVEMNNISLRLLQGGGPLHSAGNDTVMEPPKGVFFRQFLPSAHALKYDLVISAHSLLELPSAEQRLSTVLSLWRKTQGYLVIVEQGSRAAYEVVVEARDFILNLPQAVEDPTLQGHVLAPCPHDLACPRLADVSPCNFTVTYEPLLVNKRIPLEKEMYSYVILKKGKRSDGDPQWPRIVRPVIPKSRHTICRLCTKAGKLEEVVVTASKHGKETYRCTRKSKWGDLLPVDLIRTEDPDDTTVDEENPADGDTTSPRSHN